MSFRTKIFRLLPWKGGINTSQDPAVIDPSQLVKGQHLQFDVSDARNMREGINYNWDSSTANSGVNGETIIGLSDFWYGSSGVKTNYLMGLGSSGNLYRWNKGTGVRDLIPVASTASSWTTLNTTCAFEVMNNMLIYAGDQVGNVPRQFMPSASSAQDLGGSPPQAAFMREWGGRLWLNDKLNRDRVYYSPPGDPQTWNGNGDSGAFDLGIGDGDPLGVNAYLPPFQGTFYIAKYSKLYSVRGFTPETYSVQLISDGIGCVSHNAAVAIDQDDVIFLSAKGVHSLLGTIKYGDVASKYLSKDIQKTINTSWTKSALYKAWGAYLPQINSVAFAIPDTSAVGTGNSSIWLYNIEHQAWYNWPTISCQSLVTSFDSDKQRFYIGTGTGRVAKTFFGTNYDISESGSHADITMTIKTGVIYIEQNPMVVNAFKRFTLIWGPAGSVNVTVTIQIDNYSTQSFAFTQSSSNNVLGTSFVLGASVLGVSVVTGPFSTSIDGYGRAIQVTMVQSGQQAPVNIQGFAVEYEPLGPAQETILSG